MIDTNAVGPSARGSGRASNFSISGKLMSTCGRFSRRLASTICGSRCRVCGPNTRSTYGARSTIASPSWLATQPPTPITTLSLLRLELLPDAKLAEHLLLGLLADRAGVDQDHVRLGGVVGQLQAMRCLEHVDHLGRVVLVHLAAVGLDEKLAAHGVA